MTTKSFRLCIVLTALVLLLFACALPGAPEKDSSTAPTPTIAQTDRGGTPTSSVRVEQSAGSVSAAERAFAQWAATAAVDYEDVRYELLSDTGTFATVRVTALFAEGPDARWREKEADVECRKETGAWRCDQYFFFGYSAAEQQRLSTEQDASATALALVLGSTENPVIVGSFLPGMAQDAAYIAELLESQTDYVTDSAVYDVDQMTTRHPHVALLGSFAYLLAHDTYGAESALVCEYSGNLGYRGQILARADSGAYSLEAVIGKSVCWVKKGSLTGYLIQRAMLTAAGVNPNTAFRRELEIGGHPQLVEALHRGECEVGATYGDARELVSADFPDIYDKVLVIAESPLIPDLSVSFAPEVPDAVRQDLINAFVALIATQEGFDALNNWAPCDAFVLEDHSLYEGLEQMVYAGGFDMVGYLHAWGW